MGVLCLPTRLFFSLKLLDLLEVEFLPYILDCKVRQVYLSEFVSPGLGAVNQR